MYRDKTVLITGGSSGLGLALAQAYLGQGARVILLARCEKKLAVAKGGLERKYSSESVITVDADVGDYEALRMRLEPVLAQQNQLDIVINNAGIIREGYFENLCVSDFKQMVDVNLFGCLHITKLTLPYLKRSQGRIINIASMAGLVGSFGFSAYCSSKYALIGLTEVLRIELKPQGVSVHLVCPPEFKTPMVEALDSYRTRENRVNTHMIPRLDVGTVVNEVFIGIKKNKFRIITGSKTRILAFLLQHLPKLGRHLVDRQIMRVYLGP